MKDINRPRILFFLLIFFLSAFAYSLPNGFGKVQLGMSVDAVKEALKSDRQFGYRGDRDVSLSPSDGQTLIETDATYSSFSYLDRCWFQFADGKLYVITINLDSSKIDHYSVFSKLCEKYGNPNDINPKKSLWKDGSVMMSLEKPLTLKYVDQKVFDSRQKASTVDKNYSEKNRENFLEGL